jgi:MoxR-like ATPase
MDLREQIKNLRERVGSSIIGQKDVITRILIALFTDGNALLEGMPGLAKTSVSNELRSFFEKYNNDRPISAEAVLSLKKS